MASFIVKNMQYVTASGAHSRIPRKPIPGPSNPPGLAPISGVSPQILAQNAAPGTLFFSATPQPTYVVGNKTLYYAFTSLSGGVEGGMISNDMSSQLTETVVPAGTDIIQLNVYVEHGGYGPGGGGSGAIIDAFDEASGMFVDDIFVSVAPDANGSITHDANYLGAFSSAAAEVATADSFITPSNINFDKWLTMPGTSSGSITISGNQLNVGKNSNVVAFAYYRHATKLAILDHKPDIADRPLKHIGDNIFRVPGYELGDPAILNRIDVITQKLGALEGKVKEMGSAFIKTPSRPKVGATVAAKATKRK